MKLYLSSEGIPDIQVFADFIGKPADSIRLGLIFHAKDYMEEPTRSEKLTEAITYFEQFGINVEVTDVFTNPSESDMKKFDVVWLNGGNTFYLNWALTESNTKETLHEVFNSGVVYAGDSAGAVIAGNDIEKYTAADDPSQAPYIVTKGLGYTDIALIPHWGSKEYASVLSGIEEAFASEGYKTIRLTDEGYLLLEGNRIILEKL